MRIGSAVVSAALVMVLTAGIVSAGDAPALFDDVEEFTLDNGMRFLLLPRHDAPLVAGFLLVKVGNVDNPSGKTGLAHMFEHMAFKGTEKIGTSDFARESAIEDSLAGAGDELSRLLRSSEPDSSEVAGVRARLARLEKEEAGVIVPMEFPQLYDRYTYDYNAYTSWDFTAYYALFPANMLEVWALMESERLQHPVFREFYPELEVVKEERRMRIDTDPEGAASELLRSLAFTAHPYRYPVTGYMSDLEALTIHDAKRFWLEHYGPGNVIGALVGDFDVDQARELIDRYFGDILPRPVEPGPATREPPHRGIRRGVLRQGKKRHLYMAFPGYAPADRRCRVSRILASILSRNDTSRLTRRLDIEEKIARGVWTSVDTGTRYPDLFEIGATALEGTSNEKVEQVVWEELKRVVTEPPTAEKLAEITSAYRKDFYYNLRKNESVAKLLATTQAVTGDWRNVYRQYDVYDSITPEEVTAVAADLFQRDKATIVYVEPEEPGKGDK